MQKCCERTKRTEDQRFTLHVKINWCVARYVGCHTKKVGNPWHRGTDCTKKLIMHNDTGSFLKLADASSTSILKAMAVIIWDSTGFAFNPDHLLYLWRKSGRCALRKSVKYF